MRKLYTEEQYIQKANEANALGQKLYIHTFEREYERTVKDFTYEEQLQEVQVYDEEGNPLFDEEGNPITEEQLVTVAIPVMIDVEIEVQKETFDEEGNLIVDEEGNPVYETVIEIIQVQQTHQETATEEVAELLIAEKGYYICYEENYTDGTENPNFEAEKAQKEHERIQELFMTRSDFFDGTIDAWGIGEDELLFVIQRMLMGLHLENATKLKAINNFKNALNFYRKHTLFNLLVNAPIQLTGNIQVVITDEHLDNFFNEVAKGNKETAWQYLPQPVEIPVPIPDAEV
jgi:hypothetical protein